jgi:hypothetical protein
MAGFIRRFVSVFGLLLAFLFVGFAVFAPRTCPASDCLSLRTPQQIVLAQQVNPIGQHFARPVVLQQLVSHPPRRQQIVQPVVVRQQVIRQQVAPAAPRVEVIRRGIFGIPRTAVRVN